MSAKRKTLVFGNGLGMALDPEYFSLDHAIGSVWDENDVLDEHSKKLICACLPGSDRPHGESELDILHLALSSCEFLRGLPHADCHWLSKYGQRFPGVVRNFLYCTARTFHTHDFALPADFIKHLASFIRDSQSHIATLNYDNLLYSPMANEKILMGYDGDLVDGFHTKTIGFKMEHMERRYGNTFGYYLHLHGSPLFVDRHQGICKLDKSELASFKHEEVSSHIVLTHVSHKLTVISASVLLMSYWRKFEKALRESSEIVLFGYSGADKHLNDLIQSYRDEKTIKIIEWAGSGPWDKRKEFWKETLGQSIDLIHKDSVLEFVEWA